MYQHEIIMINNMKLTFKSIFKLQITKIYITFYSKRNIAVF